MSGGPVATLDPWRALREATRARVALGRAGSALPTRALLAFELDHARARDAVHRSLDVARTVERLQRLGLSTLEVESAVGDRAEFLLRPDLGRRLSDGSATRLGAGHAACDVLFVVADGLSAEGVERSAVDVIEAMRPLLDGLTVGPVVVATQARVALGDAIGAALNARLVVLLIGERPGLTSPDSVGAYLTYAPRIGRHDAERNCVSNIRPEGLPPAAAAAKIAWLVRAALRRSTSGVILKDESGTGRLE